MNISLDEFGFEVSHGYNLEKLRAVDSPDCFDDFARFWQAAFEECRKSAPLPELRCTGGSHKGWKVFDLSYQSTNEVKIQAWALIPEKKVPKRAFVITHGYGGRECPDYHLSFQDSVLIFPCLRGLGKSRMKPFSDDPNWHVLHNIDNRDHYILRGCVEDVWQCVHSILQLFPYLESHIGYLGESFGGGIGALALPWDNRIQLAHLCVPTFGNHPLRNALPCTGSGQSIQNHYKKVGDLIYKTLSYYDAAVAAKYIKIPVHCGLALVDPAVPSPGQFSIYNALSCHKKEFLLDAGHYPYFGEAEQRKLMHQDIEYFFKDL